jgi:hypothetical protein
MSEEVIIGPGPSCHACGEEYGQHAVDCAHGASKAYPEVVPLEVCENCKQQMRPRGSRCIRCGHDPRRIKR